MYRPAMNTYSLSFFGQYDPTRTLTLRNRFAKETKRRFKALNRAVRKAIIEDGILAGDVQFMVQHNDNPSEVMRKFLEWLDRQEGRDILARNGITDEMWTDVYVSQAYRQGVKRARAEMSSAGYRVASLLEDGGINNIMVQPIHRDQVKVLGMTIRNDVQNAVTNQNTIIGRLLAGAVADGRDPQLVADQITKIITGFLPETPLPEITERFMSGMQRVTTIGRTGVVKAHHIATINEYKQWGVEGVDIMAEFVTAGDDRVCERCKELAAKGPYSLEEAITMIPVHYGCVSGDSVVMAPDIQELMSSNYTGEIIKICLSNGADITVTPNHMLCTPDGFIVARFLADGDDLVYSGLFNGIIPSHPNNNRDEVTIENIVKTFPETFGMESVSVPAAAEQFHGDGISCHEDVNIVRSARLLENGINAYIIKHLGDKSFSPVCFTGALPGFRSFAHFLKSLYSSGGRDVGLSREFLAFFRGCLRHTQKHGLASTPGADTVFFQNSDYDIARESEFFRNLFDRAPIIKSGDHFFGVDVDLIRGAMVDNLKAALNEPCLNSVTLTSDGLSDGVHAFPGHVSFVKIKNIDVAHVESFPVYDCSTWSTLYTCNGVMSSNCRCIALPIRRTQ